MDYQQYCKTKLIDAIQKLGFTINHQRASEIANIIVQTMTSRWRYFHNLEHIFMVAGDDHPLEILAGLFHDLVYVQVDQTINFNLTYYLAPYINQVGYDLVIKNADNLPTDRTFEIVLNIFGFMPGQKLLTLGGQNEFLSAVVAAKVLESFFPLSLIARIVTIIEATIPFRPLSTKGFTAIEQLGQRLEITNTKFNLGLTTSEIETTLKQAVRLSNRDVSSFAYVDAVDFLDKTWSLLPETNHALVQTHNYTVKQYRLALQKIDQFFNFLQPEVIFYHFHDEPSADTHQQLIERARNNLQIGKLYLASKLIALSILEAISLRFSPDVSVSMVMGSFLNENNNCLRLIDLLPQEKVSTYEPDSSLEKKVLHLLERGRHQNLEYDLNESPLATFLVKYLTFSQVPHYRENCYAFFEGELSGEEFLATFSTELVDIIAEGVAHLFIARQIAIRCKKDKNGNKSHNNSEFRIQNSE